MPTFPLNGAVNLPARSFNVQLLAAGLATAMTGDDAGRYDRVQAVVVSLTDAVAPTSLVSISAAQSKAEGNSGNTIFTYTVTRSLTVGSLVVPWTFAAGGTIADDFTGGILPSGGGVSFADGVATGTFSISVAGDLVVEPDEVFTVSITPPAGTAPGGALSATGTILNDDSAAPAPSLSLSSAVTQAEGNSGTAAFVWTLTLFRDGSTAAIPYTWAVAGNGSNPANAADFGGTLPSGSGTFAAGETIKTITVLVAGDTAVEPAETFLLTVNATGLASVTSTGTISNDDVAVTPTVSISTAQSKSEGNSGATLYTYTVTRSASSGAVNVPWTFAAGGTTAADFTGGTLPTGGTVAMADGVASGAFSISVNGDTVVEGDETFTVAITAPSGYALGSPTSATGTITNDDVPLDPNLPASVQIVPEGDSLTAYTNTNGRPGWADQAVTGLIAGPTYMYRKVAQGGETAQAMDADFDSGVAPAAIAPGSGSVGSVGTKVGAGPAYDPSYAMNIMMLGPVGTNDDISQNSFAVYKAIRRIVMKSYAKGYARTLVSTLIPRNGVAGGDGTDTYAGHNYDADNIQINRDIAALWDSDIGADYLIDFATIWPKQTDYSVPDQSADGTHQSGTGFDKMAIPARAGLNYVIQNVGVKRMEPLTWTPWDGRAELTLSADSRTVTATGSSGGYFRYAYPNLRSGKWYFEIDPTTGTTTSIGIGTRGNKLYSTGATVASTTNSFVEVTQQGVVSIAGVATPVAQLGLRAVGDVICFALDADNHRLWIRRNSLDWNGNSDSVVSTDPSLQAGYIDLAPLRAYDVTAAGRTAAYSPYIRSYAAMTALTRFAATEHVRHRPGSFQALDLGSTKVAAVIPVNVSVPVISGEAIVGKTLTASGDTWDGSPSSYTNQWTRDGVVVSGRTGRTYAVTSADVGKRIGYSRTPINSAGTGVAAVAAPTYPALDTTSPWNPSVLGTKLVAWWKPSETSVTGTGTGTRWTEEQGNALVANQGVSGALPAPLYNAVARNGAPGVQFGGGSGLASNTLEKNFPYPGYSPIVSSFIAVSGYAPAGSTERIAFHLGDGVATRGWGIGVDAAGLIEMSGGNATAFKPASAKTWSNQDRMVSIGYAGSGTAATMTIDGVSEALTITNRTGGGARYRIGSDVSGTGSTRYFDGIIQNIYVITPVPSLTEQQKLEGYDSWITGKAGANLPSDHPYKSRAPLAGDA